MVTYPQANARIVGHTDSTGSASYNQKLSEKRASAVADTLQRLGVSPEQISVSGQGEAMPVAPNSSAEGRAQNRRVEVTILPFEYQK